MQVVTIISLHAECFQPMLANIVIILAAEVVVSRGLLLRRCWMAIRTSSTEGAMTSCECWTDRGSGYQSMTVGTAEEGREGEGGRGFGSICGEQSFGRRAG
jgi:hypothetical protein